MSQKWPRNLPSCEIGCSIRLGGDYPGPKLLIYFGIAIFPLTSLIAACTRSVVATLNPISWFRLLRIVQLAYIPAALFFYGIAYLQMYYLEPELARIAFSYDHFLVSFLCLGLSHLPMAVQGRALGTLVTPHLGRFN